MSEQNTASGGGTLRLTLVRSTIGRPKDQEATVRTLGLRKLHQTVELQDTPSVRGMVNKVRHLLNIEGGAK
ncbi:MAG: large subunit ribosomal protein [Thermomicrobiales bacterium]|jgi:large subunit ribosomal protein L30|nr:large subunit ribosomal protein [Thermomicrobiales bacterium]MEA2595676.1 large subunit ribosomal protein [Thermomicrobiales bacterium]